MHRRGPGTAGFAIVAAALLLAEPLGAQDTTRAPVRRRTTYEDLQLFSQVFNQIRVNHPDSHDSHDLIMAAIQGMIRAADPHSYVIPAVRLSGELEALSRAGKLVSLPISFAFVGGAPVVASVAAGSKAMRQDIIVGDELVAVDGKAVRAESGEELDLTLAGAAGSRATLTLERRRADGTRARLTRVVERQRLDDATAVPVVTMLDSTTGYVRVTTFANEKVADDLHAGIERLEQQGMRRLMLDLRDNGGGSVAQAARVAGEFLPSGTIVYTSAGRKKEVVDTGRVKRSFWRSEKRYPIVVLVNDGTASASELVAGALQDHDRAVIVGWPTFGKALLMQGFPLTDGSVIMLVVGQVSTPCGRVVQRAYRDISVREYYRQAAAVRDTVGRASCRTRGGRTVYGGGGVYPDRLLSASAEPPRWLAQLNEADPWLEWLGPYLASEGARHTSLEAFVAEDQLPSSALSTFRDVAKKHGVEFPPDADPAVRLLLRMVVASGKWGEAGSLLLQARVDRQVQSAMESFAQAESLSR